jgi:hypothetical protein
VTNGDASSLPVWEKAVKVQAMLATRLRLAPQARLDPKTVGRHKTSAPSAYELMENHNDD